MRLYCYPLMQQARTKDAGLLYAGLTRPQSNAAPTMIFRISSHGDPCEIEFVCVG